MNKELNQSLLNWILSDETGASSISIWAAFMDAEIKYPSVPYDTSDFRRCWNFLMILDPENRKIALHKTAEKYDIWKPYIERWRHLTELFTTGRVAELSDVLRGLRPELRYP